MKNFYVNFNLEGGLEGDLIEDTMRQLTQEGGAGINYTL